MIKIDTKAQFGNILSLNRKGSVLLLFNLSPSLLLTLMFCDWLRCPLLLSCCPAPEKCELQIRHKQELLSVLEVLLYQQNGLDEASVGPDEIRITH